MSKKNDKQKHGAYCAVHITRFPSDVWRRFGALCRLRSLTVQEGLERVLRAELETPHNRAAIEQGCGVRRAEDYR